MAAVSRSPGPPLAGERLLSLTEVGQRLGVSPVTAWRRVRSGAIRAINVGERRPLLRVRLADLEKYLESREVRPLPRSRARRRS